MDEQTNTVGSRDNPSDLFIIGGGINGCGIARDAAGRGLSVILCEQGDLAQGTSSASTKLFHGGLRYLEYYEFRLVREALIERETLLRAMPHISRPMRFILPHHSGLRPAWLLRLGLFIYDHLGGRKLLPATRTLDLSRDSAGEPLRKDFRKAFEYSDCWVDDARLVVLNARDAADRGATILTRTACTSAERNEGLWRLQTQDARSGAVKTLFAKALVNAGGPWVEEIIRTYLRQNSADKVRLVRGSHIVIAKKFAHDRAYIFQNADGRIIFAIPYEDDFTLIGTTDRDHDGPPSEVHCTEEEADYLCASASDYFEQPVTAKDIVHTYSGVRPLYDDGASSATAATRDYVLKLETGDGAPLLNIFGGKITTYRRLAEAAMAKLAPHLDGAEQTWTAGVALPGGKFPVDGGDAQIEGLCSAYPFVDRRLGKRLIRCYGTEARSILQDATSRDGLGEDFGASLTQAEVDWLVEKEWARTSDDILWRRTKLGLHRAEIDIDRLDTYLAKIANRSESKAASI